MHATDDAHDGRYSWMRLGLTLAAACVANVGMWAVIVVLPSIEAEFGLGRGTTALAYTVTMVGFAFGTLFVGRWVDKFGIARCLAAAMLLEAAGFALAAAAPTPGLVAAAHIAIGFGAAAGFGPLVADISHWFLRRRGIAISIAASGNYLSGAIWPIMLADVQAAQGWRGTYLVLALAVPTLVLPLCLALRRRIPEAASARADAAASLRRRTAALSPRALTLLLCLAGVACCVAMSMPQVHIVAYCVDLGYGPAVGAEILSLMLLGGVVSRLVSGLVADRIGGLLTLLFGSALQTAALLLFLPSNALVSLYLVSAVFGLSQGGIVPAYSIVVREYLPAGQAGARVGLVTFATILGMALGGWLSGAIFEATGSYALAFLNGVGWNLVNIAVVLGLLILSRPRPDKQPDDRAAPT